MSPRLPATKIAPEMVIATLCPNRYDSPYNARKAPIHSSMKNPSEKTRLRTANDIRADPITRGKPATTLLEYIALV